MKARDIIPGWPRGRSTVDNQRWYWQYVLMDFFTNDERIAQQTIDRIYHYQQEAMVTNFRNGYRDDLGVFLGVALDVVPRNHPFIMGDLSRFYPQLTF